MPSFPRGDIPSSNRHSLRRREPTLRQASFAQAGTHTSPTVIPAQAGTHTAPYVIPAQAGIQDGVLAALHAFPSVELGSGSQPGMTDKVN